MTENPVAIVRDVLCDWLEEVKVGDLPSEQEAAHLFGMLGTAGYSIVPNALLATARPTAPAATAEAWVSVLERLPEEFGPVDFATAHKIYHNGRYGSSRFNDGEWYVREEDDVAPFIGVKGVTHWRVVREEANPNTPPTK